MQCCENCGGTYSYSRGFLDKISSQKIPIPPPKYCPNCRQQRRLSFRNERTYYKRKCDLTGKNIISIYAPDSKVKVYEHKTWYSDTWNALDYGMDYDPSRSFFEQFFELHNRVPLISLDVKSSNQNCDYCNLVSFSKDCYQVVACTGCEESMYSTFLQRSRNVIDCFFIFDSELCYECVDCYECYNLKHSNYCYHCTDCSFLYNCNSCKDCFACVGLNQAKFRILNKEYSKEDYQQKCKQIISSPAAFADVISLWNKLKEQTAVKYYAGFQNENFSGDHLHYCKNSFDCYDCTYLEDCQHSVWFHKSKDCQDCYGFGLGGELGYECIVVGNNFSQLLFCDSCSNGVSNLTYCKLCLDGSRDLFGCVSLRGKKYCILNKQYTKEQYEVLLEKITKDMKARGEWGEYFPSHCSPFAYNETVANEYFPLTKADAISKGLRWSEKLPYSTGKETISKIPTDLNDSVLEEILCCECCKRNYKINELELRLYKKLELKIPEYCFTCRHMSRQLQRNPRILKKVKCNSCKQELESTFENAKVLCEKCYLETK